MATPPFLVPLQDVSMTADDNACPSADQFSCNLPLLERRHRYELIGAPVEMHEDSVRLRRQ
jgi:hypothetical protein